MFGASTTATSRAAELAQQPRQLAEQLRVGDVRAVLAVVAEHEGRLDRPRAARRAACPSAARALASRSARPASSSRRRKQRQLVVGPRAPARPRPARRRRADCRRRGGRAVRAAGSTRRPAPNFAGQRLRPSRRARGGPARPGRRPGCVKIAGVPVLVVARCAGSRRPATGGSSGSSAASSSDAAASRAGRSARHRR